MAGSGLTKLCVLHRDTLPLYHVREIFSPHELGCRKWEQENDSYHRSKWKRWKSGIAGGHPEGKQSSRYVQVQGRGREGACGMRSRAGRLCRQAEFAQGSAWSEFRLRRVFSDSATRGTGEQYAGRVPGSRREACGAELSDGGGRLREIVSELASQGRRQAQGNGDDLHDSSAERVFAEHRGLQRAKHSRARSVLCGDGRGEGQLSVSRRHRGCRGESA